MTSGEVENRVPRWSFWVDVGGTFTDCLAEAPDGQRFTTKVLSSAVTRGILQQPTEGNQFRGLDQDSQPDSFWNGAKVCFLDDAGNAFSQSTVVDFRNGVFRCELLPALTAGTRYELHPGISAPLLAIHRMIKLPIRDPLPDCDLYLGTTRGTNALLTRSGARTALVTTAGLGDLLRIGDQSRPDLFALEIVKPVPLFETSIEIDERTLADGTVERSPDLAVVRQQMIDLRQAGIQAVAICLMNSYQRPDHEKQVAQVAEEVGFESVRVSSQLARSIKIVPRGETTVLDAYLNPVISRYLDEIQGRLTRQSCLRLMTSSGGLVSRQRFSGKESVLSGPAGGVVGAARVAEQLGFGRVIAFDMGGTSTDVSRYDGRFEHEFESLKAGVRIVSPVLAVETVAAGGGSICWFDGKRMQVGPASASADPGPACYGGGGPLTITDINLFLGRVAQQEFPIPLNEDAVGLRLREVHQVVQQAGFDLTLQQLAEGFLDIANNNMASAIRSISVSQGYDPSDYLLVSFGGAGSQHCCAVADKLKIRQILDHPQSSILSAVGIELADQTAFSSRPVLLPLADWGEELRQSAFQELRESVRQKLEQEGIQNEAVVFKYQLDLRYAGTDPCLTISEAEDSDFQSSFESTHQRLYGYTQSKPVEVVAARVEGLVRAKSLPSLVPEPAEGRSLASTGESGPIQFNDLIPGDRIPGPAMIVDPFKTTIVDPGWLAIAQSNGSLLLERVDVAEPPSVRETPDFAQQPNPVQLEIFNSHFSAIAKQMGIALRKTSTSVNVKERLDFSCAVFTRQGDLVVNAPHIPVHLGAMSETVRSTIHLNPGVQPGDVFLTNDPYQGGSHLPDVTTVTPVFEPSTGELIFWVASRSHHAEIGGKAPGSMPADARVLGEEGVLIQNFQLVANGKERFDELRQLLTEGPYPSRSPDDNLGDIAAQVAANRRGESDLLQLVTQYSLPQVEQYMQFMQEAAEAKVRSALQTRFQPGTYRFVDSMDTGAVVQVEVRVEGDRLSIDFTGTSPVGNDNLNANRAIVSAAVMYVMRSLIDENIPLNQGVLNPVTIYLPICFLNPLPSDDPRQSPAVVGGNVETSQRVVDVLLGALGIAAASQGTMNNWLMGDPTFGYYETVCGGSGATSRAAGADAVHTHMTNTRLTDPEILEQRYPAVLREFSIRKNSGGQGRHRGGDGIRREIEFRKPLTLSLLTSRRNTEPFGLEGGHSGQSGINQLITASGNVTRLPSQCQVAVLPGDRLVLQTPGGGGYGCPGEANDLTDSETGQPPVE